MNEANPNPVVPDFKDRHTGLLAFGVLEIVLGAGCILMILLMFLGQAMSAQMTGTKQEMRMLVPGMMVYGVMAAAFIWLGIGSIKCRRWARGLLLILGWSGLLVGVMIEVAMPLVLPHVFENGAGGDQAMPKGVGTVVVIVSMLVVGVLFVVIPGAMVLFYSSRNVKATCEARDPARRWTDACPLPVLAVSCWLWFGGLTMLASPFGYGGVLPFFGTLISGAAGVFTFIAFAALWFWLGWMFYRLRPSGWWTLMLVLLVFTASNAITFSRVDILEMYRKMSLPEEQIEQLRQQGLVTSRTFIWWTIAVMVPMLGYLLWVKRWFNPRPEGIPNTTGSASR